MLPLQLLLQGCAVEREVCTWEVKDEIRFVLTHEKGGDRYLRESEMAMTFLSEQPRTIRYNIEGQSSYWYVRTLGPDDEEVTGNDEAFLPPPIPEPQSVAVTAQPLTPPSMPALIGRVVFKGETIVEKLEWDHYLISMPDGTAFQKWNRKSKYLVVFRPKFQVDEVPEMERLVRMGVSDHCMLGNVGI